MVLRGAQIHRRDQAKCSLFSTQSLPHDLAPLCDRVLPFTSANLANIVGPRLESVAMKVTSLTIGRSRKIVPMNRLIRRRP
jgi:hypothetical protein